ncbi:hypothetical protein SDC9_54888 [bioreactor metagenome]|uniref:Uncharacterized protein n=1 Tax=bioreactor metagenome TaxID=1076179 RepID=A0A644WXC9_9ZZZZ
MIRRGAAAAAHDVHQAFGGELVHQSAGDVGRFVKAGVAHRVGQAGIGVATDEGVGRGLVQLLDVGAHQGCAQRAVQADGQRVGVAHAVPEGGDGLAREDAARGVGDGAADHDGQHFAGGVEGFLHREQGGLGVQGVEDGLDQDDIRAAFDQRHGLLEVCLAQLLEGDVARARVVHVGADAGGLGRGAQGACDEARVVRRGVFVAGRARQLGRGQVHLARQIGHAVVFLRNGGGAEGVGLDQVGACGQVFFVDVADHVGAGEREQLVVALHVARKVLEPVARTIGPAVALTAILRLAQLEALNHRAHGTVEDGNALSQDLGQLLGAGVVRQSHNPQL